MSPARPSPATSRVRLSFIASPGRGRVGQERHLAGVLDRLGELALLLRADPGDPPGTDLAAVGDELAQQRGVLVVDVVDLRRGERILLLLGLANRWFRHRDAPYVSVDCVELERRFGSAAGDWGRTPRVLGLLAAGSAARPAAARSEPAAGRRAAL